jgi:O-antigen/teichoic acid export membrane protein
MTRFGRTKRKTLLLLGTHGVNALLQAGFIFLLGRALGPEGFGLWMAIYAFVLVLAPFAGWGSTNLLVKYIARDESQVRVQWGNNLVALASTSMLLGVLALGLGRWILPEEAALPLVAGLALTEFLLTQIVGTAALVFLTLERTFLSALLMGLQYLVRFLAVATLYWFVPVKEIGTFAWLYVGGVGAACLVALAAVQLAYGTPRPDLGRLLATWKEGMSFAVGASSRVVYTDIDKVLITRLADLNSAGIYTAAYKSISLALMPLLALFLATYADFFRSGREGIDAAWRYGKRVMRWTALYGVLAAGAIALLAEPVMRLFGPEYEGAGRIVLLLAPLPVLKALYLPLGDALTGSGFQASRSIAQIVCGLVNLVLCLLLIPSMSWMGAVVATLATESLMLAIYAVLVSILVRRALSAKSASVSAA